MTAISKETSKRARIRPRWLASTGLITVSFLFSLFVLSIIGVQNMSTVDSVMVWLIGTLGINSATGVAQPHSLYITSETLRPNSTSGSIGGRVIALDRVTLQERYSIPTGVDLDVTQSPDGARLYIASIDPLANCHQGNDYLKAIETKTGAEVWQATVQDRVKYNGGGPATLALSPDGRWLYVYSYPWCDLHRDADGSIPYWLQIVDTNNGRILRDTISLSGCGAARLTPGLKTEKLYVTCFDSNEVQIVDLNAHQVKQRVSIAGISSPLRGTGSIADAILSRDGHSLYVVTNNLQISVIDVQNGTNARQIDLGPQISWGVRQGLVALSPDGNILVLAEDIQAVPGTDTDSEVHLVDTRTWQELRHFRTGQPITAPLLIDPGGSVIYMVGFGSNGKPLADADTILTFSLTGTQDRTPLVRKGEGITHLLFEP